MEVFRQIVLVSVMLAVLWIISVMLTTAWQSFFIWINDQDATLRQNPILQAAKRHFSLDGLDSFEVFLGGVVALVLWPISLAIVLIVVLALRERESRRRYKQETGAEGEE